MVDAQEDVAQRAVEDNVSVHIAVEATDVVILKILRHGRKVRQTVRIESANEKEEKQQRKCLRPRDSHFTSAFFPVFAVCE